VPVINAGDGAGEHPTQTLVDLYTISQNLGRLDGVKVAMVGDLRYGRTVHSLLPALRTMGGDAVAVPAPGLELPDDLGASVPTVSLDVAARTCDVLYVTRIQEERLPDTQSYAKLKGMLRVDAALLKKTKSKAIVLHPLPRVDEISRDVDALPSAKYFDQARNGVVVRMAILDSILGETA
jgi:aspartate carbamoyltransferase catalytic subunit